MASGAIPEQLAAAEVAACGAAAPHCLALVSPALRAALRRDASRLLLLPAADAVCAPLQPSAAADSSVTNRRVAVARRMTAPCLWMRFEGSLTQLVPRKKLQGEPGRQTAAEQQQQVDAPHPKATGGQSLAC